LSEDILPLARQVATELWGKAGDAQYAHGMAGTAYLTLIGSDQKLFFRPDWKNRDKLLISGVYPATDMNPDQHYIRVSPTRNPKAIASDISRRLLPGYRTELDKVKAYNSRVSGDQAKRVAVLSEVTSAMGSAAGQDEDMPDRHKARVTLLSEHGYGDVEIGHDGEHISLNLRYLPKEVALKMLAVLSEDRTASGS
jgi:hypothetical protein